MNIMLRSGRYSWIAARTTESFDHNAVGKIFHATIKYDKNSSDVQMGKLLIEYISPDKSTLGVTLTS